MRITVWRGVRFIAAALVTFVVSLAALVLLMFTVTPGKHPPDPLPAAVGQGLEVRKFDKGRLRIEQRCHGACDAVTL